MTQLVWDLGETDPVFLDNPKPIDFARHLVSWFDLDWKLGETTGGFAPPVYFYDRDNSFLGVLAYVGHNGVPIIIVAIDAEGGNELTTCVSLDLGDPPKQHNPRS